jgi:hypothetical protein
MSKKQEIVKLVEKTEEKIKRLKESLMVLSNEEKAQIEKTLCQTLDVFTLIKSIPDDQDLLEEELITPMTKRIKETIIDPMEGDIIPKLKNWIDSRFKESTIWGLMIALILNLALGVYNYCSDKSRIQPYIEIMQTNNNTMRKVRIINPQGINIRSVPGIVNERTYVGILKFGTEKDVKYIITQKNGNIEETWLGIIVQPDEIQYANEDRKKDETNLRYIRYLSDSTKAIE